MEYLPQYLDYLAAEYGDMSLMNKLHHEEKSFARMLSRGVKMFAAVRKLESKEGRKFSAATKKSLDEAHEHVKGLSDIFGALFDDEADDDTDDTEDDTNDTDGDDDGNKGGGTPASQAAKKSKPEPVAEDHSAAEAILTNMRALIPKA
jgi:hypothetical protein